MPWRWIERLDEAELVDAPVDDLDRLVDHLADALEHGRLGEREPDQPAADAVDIDRTLAGGAEQAADRLRQLAQLGQALLQIGFADAHLDAVAAHDRGRLQADARLAQHPAHVVLQLLDSFCRRTSLASTSSRMCEPPCRSSPSTMWRCAHFGQRCTVALGKEIRHREQAEDERREQDRRRLPLAKCKA